MPTATEKEQMQAYCLFKQQIDGFKAKTRKRRGELKSSISKCRQALLDFLNEQQCDVLQINNDFAVKRCVCSSFARVQRETIVDAFKSIYDWGRLQPLLSAGDSLAEAVRALLKEEVTERCRKCREYGDLVGVQSRKCRTRVSLNKNDARREKRIELLPASIVEIIGDLRRCIDEMQELQTAQKEHLRGIEASLKRMEACVMDSLRCSELGKSEEYHLKPTPLLAKSVEELIAVETVTCDPDPLQTVYTCLPPPDVATASQGPVVANITSRDNYAARAATKMSLQYKKHVRAPVLSVAKMDLCVGFDLQRYFEEIITVPGERLTKRDDLPPVTISIINALIEQSMNNFVEEGMREHESVSVRTGRGDMTQALTCGE